MKCFFDSKEFNGENAEFFKVLERPLSTNKIKTELHEYANRTKRRLGRLERSGFIRRKEKRSTTRTDSFWYPRHATMYFILSMLQNNDERRKFIETNKEKSHLFLILKNKVTDKQLDFFVKDIRTCVRKQQYSEIMKVVRSFLQNIETRYVDWTLELEPNQRLEYMNTDTNEIELY